MAYTRLYITRNPEPAYIDPKDEVVIGQGSDLEIPSWSYGRISALKTTFIQRGIRPDHCHAATMIRSRNMAYYLCAYLDGQVDVVSRPELNEQCLGADEGKLVEHVFAPESPAIQGLTLLGADYRHPGKNEEGVPGESTRDVVRRMAGYVRSLRTQPEVSDTVIAVSDQMAQQALSGFIEIGGFEDGQTVDSVDAHELFAARLRQPEIGYCALSSVVVEGGYDDLRCHIEYIGEPLR